MLWDFSQAANKETRHLFAGDLRSFIFLYKTYEFDIIMTSTLWKRIGFSEPAVLKWVPFDRDLTLRLCIVFLVLVVTRLHTAIILSNRTSWLERTNIESVELSIRSWSMIERLRTKWHWPSSLCGFWSPWLRNRLISSHVCLTTMAHTSELYGGWSMMIPLDPHCSQCSRIHNCLQALSSCTRLGLPDRRGNLV